MERSESSETRGTRQTERKREGGERRNNNRAGGKWRSGALNHRCGGVSPFFSMKSIRRTTDCHWQMLHLSSPSLSFPSPIVKPMDQGVNTGLSVLDGCTEIPIIENKTKPVSTQKHIPWQAKPLHAFEKCPSKKVRQISNIIFLWLKVHLA